MFGLSTFSTRHMQNSLPLSLSKEALVAINRSTELTRALQRIQPEEISLQSLAKNPGQVSDTEALRLRTTISCALFSAAIDHHVALVLLARNHMRSSAFSLLRVVFDAAWRGAWAAYVAPESNLTEFVVGRAYFGRYWTLSSVSLGQRER